MGNGQTRNCDQQRDGFFTALPEDIMILLTDLLSTQDFIHLITTCKYYNHELLGANNALWSRVCRSLGGANKILKELQHFRDRKTDLNKEIDLTDKAVLGSIDFKKEVFMYYMLIINDQLLRKKFEEFLGFGTHVTVKVLPFSFWTNFYQYWTRADLKSNKNLRDYFYEVDLAYDPASVEESNGHKQLPSEQGGRAIVYKKSKEKYVEYIPISRCEMPYEFDQDKLLDEIQEQMRRLEQTTKEVV